ncbi:MAG TPA: hypothetical protein VGX24_02350 [Pyrinomonadaceae bacterium]|nr:hypothetical protein [Pyrinomonadaceae bacterium]
MTSRLWHMNADFETELAAGAGTYRRPLSFVSINRRLAPHLLWLAVEGDALLVEETPSESFKSEAARRGVELLTLDAAQEEQQQRRQADRIFTPWGWMPRMIALGEQTGARVLPVPLEVVRRVNSKLWSHALEQELGIAMAGACAAASFAELAEALAHACPRADDKWVIKSPYGFAARERVLGRGARLEGAQATWVRRQFAAGETLIFQPWLERVREYGVTLEITDDGEINLIGISDLQTNGAGTGTGYLLGRQIDAGRKAELESLARVVGARLFREGYTGPAGMDALEHAGGLHPLLEINARYTMGFVALAVERALKPQTPILWELK